MPSFLLVFNRRTGERPVFKAFDRSSDAVRARFELERKYRGAPDIEVVVLTAKSESEVRATHGRYFESLSDLVDSGRAELAA
jgi:hypothetical protein